MASLYIRVGGVILFLFIVFHMAHFTWGIPGIHPDVGSGDRTARAPVAYASGFDPTRDDRMAVWERARLAVGGDDFAEAVPLEWVDAALTARSPEFALAFGPDAIGLMLPDASPDR